MSHRGKPGHGRYARPAAFLAALVVSGGLVMSLMEEARAASMFFSDPPTSVATTANATFTLDITVPAGQRIPFTRIVAVIEKQAAGQTASGQLGKVAPTQVGSRGCRAGIDCPATEAFLEAVGPNSSAITTIDFVGAFRDSVAGANQVSSGFFGYGALTGTKSGYGYDTVSNAVSLGGYGYGYFIGDTSTVSDSEGLGYGYGTNALILRYNITVDGSNLTPGRHYLTVIGRTSSAIMGTFSSPFAEFSVQEGGAGATIQGTASVESSSGTTLNATAAQGNQTFTRSNVEANTTVAIAIDWSGLNATLRSQITNIVNVTFVNVTLERPAANVSVTLGVLNVSTPNLSPTEDVNLGTLSSMLSSGGSPSASSGGIFRFNMSVNGTALNGTQIRQNVTQINITFLLNDTFLTSNGLSASNVRLIEFELGTHVGNVTATCGAASGGFRRCSALLFSASTFIITSTPAAAAAGDSGGGGGGTVTFPSSSSRTATSGVPPEGAVARYTTVGASLASGGTLTVTFPVTEADIKQFKVTTARQITSLNVIFDKYTTPKAGTTAIPSGFDDQFYVEITLREGTNATGSSDVTSGELTFTVTTSAISVAGVTDKAPVLLQLKDSWNALTTTKGTTEDSRIRYAGTIPSFSMFAAAIDTAPPAISSVTPASGGTTTAVKPEVRAEYGDNRGVDAATVKFTLDATDVTTGATVAATRATFVPEAALALGAHTAKVELMDLSGLSAMQEWTFTVTAVADTSAPTITSLTPADGAATNDATPAIAAAFTDDVGVVVEQVTLSLDGTDVTGSATITATSLTFTPSTELAEGEHTIQVVVKDAVDNAATKTSTFLVDLTLPVIGEVSPKDKQVGDKATIKAAYEDALAGIDTAMVTLTLDGKDVTGKATVTATALTFKAKDLKDGKHTAELSVADRAGNVETETWSFTAESGPSALAIILIVLLILALAAGGWWYVQQQRGGGL